MISVLKKHIKPKILSNIPRKKLTVLKSLEYIKGTLIFAMKSTTRPLLKHTTVNIWPINNMVEVKNLVFAHRIRTFYR